MRRDDDGALRTDTYGSGAACARTQALARDLVDAALTRIDRLDGSLQAWAAIDHAGGRSAAAELDREARQGHLRGPLHGVPIGIKDIFYTAGLKTEAGSKALAGFVPTTTLRLSYVSNAQVRSCWANWRPPSSRSLTPLRLLIRGISNILLAALAAVRVLR